MPVQYAPEIHSVDLQHRRRARHDHVRAQEVPKVHRPRVREVMHVVAVQVRQAAEVEVAQAVRRRTRREAVSLGEELVQRRRQRRVEVRVQVLPVPFSGAEIQRVGARRPRRLGRGALERHERLTWRLVDGLHRADRP